MSSVIKLYPNGLTAGVPPTGGPKSRGNRKALQGWSAESIRSNTRFLYSVQADRLDGLAYTLSLTIADCPPTPDHWHARRRRFLKRMQRRELERGHWLTEWQRRMVPHLHGCLFFRSESEIDATGILDAWLDAMADYRPSAWAQCVKPMHDAVGWFQYVSKHAARGLRHYQRSPEMIPPAWLGKTGRMWGTVGEWPTAEALTLNTGMPGYHAFRRLLRARRIADARQAGNANRIRHARQMLKCSDPKRSAVRGGSDWCDLDEGLALLAAVRGLGHEVYA